MKLQLGTDEYIGVGVARVILGVSRPTVYKLLAGGHLTTFTIGGRMLLRRVEVEKLAAQRRQAQT